MNISQGKIRNLPMTLMADRLLRIGNVNSNNTSTLTGVADISNRLGGKSQQDRMIKDKRLSFDRALLYSYQGANIKKQNNDVGLWDTNNDRPAVRVLINPNKLKQDYDEKILSVGYEFGFQPGDVFEWVGTNTHWLIYLQYLEEMAYFRANIRKCSYEIDWIDEEGNSQMTYAAIRGPVETDINYIQKHGISVDNPNYSLNFLVPKNEATLAQFQRYKKFYLQDDTTCWRVSAVDTISTPGIIEVNAKEYYANETEDDIENGIVGKFIAEETNPNQALVEELIRGETFIKPKIEYTYTYRGAGNNTWFIDSKYPVKYTINDNTIKLKWDSSYSGQFDLKCGNYTKTIVVESLF